jgi:hypothetical protein
MNKCFINYSVQGSKSENSHNYGSLIKHGPHSINFIILIFISGKIYTLDICTRF